MLWLLSTVMIEVMFGRTIAAIPAIAFSVDTGFSIISVSAQTSMPKGVLILKDNGDLLCKN